MSARSRNKNKNKFDHRSFLNKSKIPHENVIDLKKVFFEEEARKKRKSRPGLLQSLKGGFAKKKSGLKTHIEPREKPVKRRAYKLKVNWLGLSAYTLVLVILILPFFIFWGIRGVDEAKGKVLGASAEALASLKSASKYISEFKISKAKGEFKNAENSFLKAQSEINNINKFLFQLIKLIPFKGSALTSGQHLIEAGKNVAEIGQVISNNIEPLIASDLSFKEGSFSLSKVILSLDKSLDQVSKKIVNTTEHIKKVNPNQLPKNYQEEIIRLKNILPDLEDYFARLRKIIKITLKITGQDSLKEYLFIFQNNQELRPTGGFIGSLALVDMDKGNIRILEVPARGPYEINDDLEQEIIPPKPLWLINNKWQIQDANWFPDFPASAEKINWFYEISRGFKVDGVMSFTPDIIIELLKITGPITLDKYELILTSDNFIKETQKQTELAYDLEVNRPKQIIADLIPILLNNILKSKPQDFPEIIKVFNTALGEKEIMVYLSDKNLEKEIKALGWAGEIKTADKDYLMVVNTNIGGGKTDGVIAEEITHQVEIKKDGTVINTVTVRRNHQGKKDDIFTGIKNMDYMRFYVPLGSKLLKAQGFSLINKDLIIYPGPNAKEDPDLLRIEKNPIIDERTNTRITEEFGKTVFANWLGLEQGESKEVSITYELPFKLTDEKEVYSVYFQKQPGSMGSNLKTRLILSQGYEIVEQIPKGMAINPGVLYYEDSLKTDKVYGVILEKK